jgi:1-acyl-sn-glycerol-3-phosphate acyltransferase
MSRIDRFEVKIKSMFMACLRAVSIVMTLLFFLVVITPFQIIAVRLNLKVAAFGQMALCRVLLFLMRTRVHPIGMPSPLRPRLIVANHISWVDILVFAAIEPVCFLAKREVSAWPLVASFAKAQLTVFVDRQRRRSIPPANRAMAKLMGEGRNVLLFPEGTTYDGTALGPFHSSHFAAARDLLASDQAASSVSLQPAAVFYSAANAGWTGDMTLIPHLWEILCSPPMQAYVAFGDPLVYERGSDRKVLCAASKGAIGDLLQRYKVQAEDVSLQSEPKRIPLLQS